MPGKIAALICGRLDDNRFPGRNTFPLIGRPMMVYPILAAQHALRVDGVFVTTDAPAIARVAAHHGAEIIERPPELCGAKVALEAILAHGYSAIRKIEGDLDALAVLLCNAPTVTGGMIDQGIEILLNDPSKDAVMSVSLHNEFHPSYALQLNEEGRLVPHAEVVQQAAGLKDAYFPDALLWVLRPSSFFTGPVGPVLPSRIVNCAAQCISPLIHEGYGDVDYVWQIPAVEEWLRRQGFSEEATPYDRRELKPVGLRTEKPCAPPRRAASPTGRRVLITTIPFGEVARRPLELLDQAGVDYVINPIGRKLRESELADLIGDVDVLIAGTEPITARVMERAPRLRLISRVGIGLDSVDLVAARQRNILVSYTPDAPAPAVAELVVGLILSALRRIPNADRGMRNGVWHRFMGRRLENLTVGVIGVGRVGKRVIRHLAGFGSRILANDLEPDLDFGGKHDVQWVEKEQLYRESDIITLHLPLTPLSTNLVTARELCMMKSDALLINTSRGNMIDERALTGALQNNRLGGAAIDVFQQEPYSGPLANLDNCVLTCHMGSMSEDCRLRMEVEATEEALRFIKGEPLRQLVPEHEYTMRESRKGAR